MALLRAVVSGNPKFFLGTDSAPHPVIAKTCGTNRRGKVAAGVFTQPYATQLIVNALDEACKEGVIQERDVTKEKLQGFLGEFGRRFYRVSDTRKEKIFLRKKDEMVVEILERGEVGVVPFKSGKTLGWSLDW
jgi:dihydroorotase